MTSRRDHRFEPRHARSLPELLRPLGQAHRLAIIKRLGLQPSNVQDLSDWLGRMENTVSHALHTLHELGLVTFSREGRFVMYRLTERVRLVRKGDSLTINLTADDGDAIEIHTSANAVPAWRQSEAKSGQRAASARR